MYRATLFGVQVKGWSTNSGTPICRPCTKRFLPFGLDRGHFTKCLDVGCSPPLDVLVFVNKQRIITRSKCVVPVHTP